ncbi:hypothetical protein JCM15519_33720 [Fundidesulfovibrio butyratiphilus]
MDRRRALSLAAVVFFSLAAALSGTSAGLLSSADRWCWDVYHVLGGKRHDPRDTLIVSLDNRVLAANSDTPLVFWGPLYAKALERLKKAGAAAIAMDMYLGITPEQWLRTLGPANIPDGLLDYDQTFDQSLAGGGVLLSARPVRDGGATEVPFPAREYLDALPGHLRQVGLTILHRDGDNVVRRMVPAYDPQGEGRREDAPGAPDGYEPPSPWWTLSALAVRTAKGEGVLPAAPAKASPIAFCGPPGTIERLSLADLVGDAELSPADAAKVKGRVVFLGAEFKGSGDRQPTPYSRQLFWMGHRDMSGVEIHANIAETLLHPGRLGMFPLWLAALLWLPFLVGAALVCDRSSPWTGGGVKSALLGLGWLMGFAFFLAGKLFPVGGLVVGLGAVFAGVSGLRMTRTERDRARIRRLFGKYVSEEALEHILRSRDEPRLGGDGAQITVLFSDIRNFTTLSETLTPVEVVELLNAYFGRACEAVQQHGGMVDKFIGDAIMGVFGTPYVSADHARNAVLAALELRAVAEEFQQWVVRRFPQLGPSSFRIGVGIHTGEAIVGNIGSPRRMEFTAIGDTVNTASRLEGLTKQLGCVVVASRDTVIAAGPSVVTGKEAELAVKGKARPVAVFEVVDIENKEESLS